jgi:predicted branched-subunit amino acid permease
MPLTTLAQPAPAPATAAAGTAARPASGSPVRAAVADLGTMLPGIVPFGITLGVTADALGAGPFATVLGGAALYAGSAHLTAVTLMHDGAATLAVVAAAAIVNARLMLYGAALEKRFRGQPLAFRLLGPAFLIDQTYLAATARPAGDDGPAGRAAFRRYWLLLGGGLLVAWVTAIATGVLLGPLLPDLPHLAFAGVAMFVAMLVPRLTTRPALAAAAAAAAAAPLAAAVVPALGVLAGVAAGVVAGVLTRGDDE